jgi:DNA-binding response OmpR family regulator
LIPSTRLSPTTPSGVVGTVLVVEDDEETLSIIARTLAAGGFEVLWARDRADAVKLLDRHARAIDLVVTDVVLPDTTATDLVQAVVERYPAARCVYVSAYDEDTVRGHGIDPDRVPFMPKPCEPADLLALVRKTLGR